MNRLVINFFSVLLLLSACTKIPGSGDRKGPIQDPDSMEYDAGTFDSVPVMKEFLLDMDQFGKKVMNVPYVDNAVSARQHLDILYPEETIGPYKVVVVFHSGGWYSGDKQGESIAPIVEVINQGYALVSVNYRYSSEARWPAQLHDAKAAIRFLRANMDTYRLDTEKVVVWGIQSGAHLGLMLAATNDLPEYEDLTQGNIGLSSRVDGVVAWAPFTDLTSLSSASFPMANRLMGFNVKTSGEKALKASPIHYVTNQFPPVLLVHGTADSIAPYQQSVKLLHKINLETGDLRAELVTFEDGIHNDPMLRTSVNVLNNLDFVDKIYYKKVNPYRTSAVMDIKLNFNAEEND